MRRKNLRKRKEKKHGWLRRIIFGLVLLLIAVCVFFLRTEYWNRDGKLAVVTGKGQDVVISLYDSPSGNQTEIVVPGNTQVSAAYGLGTWKLGSLWKLGVDEKIGDSLMTRTVSLNFGLPVFISSGKLSVGDRLRICLFNLFNRNQKDVIYLKETGYLKKTVFLDGEKGYLVNKDIPEEISSLFSDQEQFGNLLKAKIIDSVGNIGIANKIGKIIETMGIKVASISKGAGTGTDCRVVGNNKDLVRKVALILGCGRTEVKDPTNFDLEIYLGNQY